MRGPPSRGQWVGGWRLGGGNPHTHAHTHTHVRHDKHGCHHGGGHLQFSNMLTLAFYVCACEHACVYMSGGTPHAPDAPKPICPLPQSCREPKSLTVNKS